MQTRRLGSSDLMLSTVGLGAWAIGGPWAHGWGPQDDAESIRTIHRALELGVNWIDTAAVYGLGHSEEVVARALADRRGEVIVATKCGLRWKGDGSIYSALDAKSIRSEVEASLRRLDVEAIDLYQIHWPNPARQIEQGWSVLADLVQEGKIRHAGVSNFSVAQMKGIQSIWPITSLQPPYSMVNRGVERQILPFCAANNIGVVAYSPMQCGLLTGAFTADRLAGLDSGDWRRKDRFFKEPLFSRTLALTRKLRPLAERWGHTMAQLSIAWVLRRPEVTAAIVGARRPSQIEEIVAEGDWELSAQELEQIDVLLADTAVQDR